MSLINPIFIRTKVGEHTIFTVYQSGLWLTLCGDGGVLKADSLFQASTNHLEAAYSLREKVMPAKTWQERAERDNGFIDDDMGCNDADLYSTDD